MCIQVVSSGRGLRHNTRDCFSKARRKRGVIPETVFQRVYKVGDYVDVVCDPAQQKGMPFKFYHGKTGRVWNVTKRALGVEMNKQVGGRIMKKRLHVRIEHVRPSRCREEFLLRREKNDKAKKEAKARGEMIGASLKRQPQGPRPAFTLTNVSMYDSPCPSPLSSLSSLSLFCPVVPSVNVVCGHVSPGNRGGGCWEIVCTWSSCVVMHQYADCEFLCLYVFSHITKPIAVRPWRPSRTILCARVSRASKEVRRRGSAECTSGAVSPSHRSPCKSIDHSICHTYTHGREEKERGRYRPVGMRNEKRICVCVRFLLHTRFRLSSITTINSTPPRTSLSAHMITVVIVIVMSVHPVPSPCAQTLCKYIDAHTHTYALRVIALIARQPPVPCAAFPRGP